MKQCPSCRRTYADETLSFCLEDGSPLVAQNITSDITQRYVPEVTQRFDTPRNFAAPSPETFRVNPPVAQTPSRGKLWIIPAFICLLLLIAGGSLAVYLLTKNKPDKSPETTVHTVAANTNVAATNVAASNVAPANSTAPANVAAANINKPTASPTDIKPPSFKLVGTWQSDVIEQGVKTHITYVLNADGTSKAFFKTARGQTGSDRGTWQFSDDILYEKFSNGVSGKGSIRSIDDDTFEITIIDNGTPAYSGLKRIYHRSK